MFVVEKYTTYLRAILVEEVFCDYFCYQFALKPIFATSIKS